MIYWKCFISKPLPVLVWPSEKKAPSYQLALFPFLNIYFKLLCGKNIVVVKYYCVITFKYPYLLSSVFSIMLSIVLINLDGGPPSPAMVHVLISLAYS